jgi:hypothetical protein
MRRAAFCLFLLRAIHASPQAPLERGELAFPRASRLVTLHCLPELCRAGDVVWYRNDLRRREATQLSAIVSAATDVCRYHSARHVYDSRAGSAARHNRARSYGECTVLCTAAPSAARRMYDATCSAQVRTARLAWSRETSFLESAEYLPVGIALGIRLGLDSAIRRICGTQARAARRWASTCRSALLTAQVYLVDMLTCSSIHGSGKKCGYCQPEATSPEPSASIPSKSDKMPFQRSE